MKRRTFTPEFKREAVRQLELGEKPSSDLARELAILATSSIAGKKRLIARERLLFQAEAIIAVRKTSYLLK